MNSPDGTKPPTWWYAADAYLRWAHQTDFRYFSEQSTFGVLVELKTGLDSTQRTTLEGTGVTVAEVYNDKCFITAVLRVADRQSQLEAFANIFVKRVELATPVAAPPSQSDRPPGITGPGKPTRLLGVIDDGCPFAHAGLCANGNSRIAFLWDQGATARRVDPNDGRPISFGSEFGYGYNFFRDGLERAIKAGTPVPSMPDEDAVYEITGQERLRPLASHGAHVLGLAASRTLAMNRISPSRCSGADATEPPSWAPDPHHAADTALGFVQIPRASLDDSSGRWLGKNILDGIHAFVAYAKDTVTIKRVTINVSYGPQTGPHDGSSLLERAIDEVVSDIGRTHVPIDELFVVLPVGNSFQSRAHAEFDLKNGGGALTWHVPPDSETPAFLEIWLPRDVDLNSASVNVSSPVGISLMAAADAIVEPKDRSWQIVATNPVQGQWTVLVALGATAGFTSDARPPHGRWAVSVSPSARVEGVAHAYIARNDYNFGGLRKGRPSHFWLESYDPNRFMRSREDDLPLPVGSPPPGVRILSAGSMSGLATGAESKVAAGFCISEKKPAIYSGGGPSRGGRKAPDWAYPTDESRVFPGLISWGNRSSASVRLMGTSAAAPQYARAIDRDGMSAVQPPNPPPPLDPRLGWGRKEC